ncbi:MAG: restriction endonuclease [Paracoccaceae bacterium]
MKKRNFTIESEGFPDLAGMMLVTLQALRELGGSARIDELADKVIELEGVTEEEQSFQMSGDDPRSRLNYYLAWSRTYLKNGGALENSSRGVWSLTEKGENIESRVETQEIQEAVLKASRDKKRAKKVKSTDGQQDELVPPKSFGDLTETEFSDWKTELLSVLTKMDPYAFERLSQRLLREAGFTKVEVRGKSGDGGIDGVGVLRVNLVSFQVFFQCKRWQGSVGPSVVRDFRGAMQGRADKGLIITTAKFTSSAHEEATRDGATAIDLIDGDRLCELIKENSLGVSTEMIEHVSIDRSWFEGF